MTYDLLPIILSYFEKFSLVIYCKSIFCNFFVVCLKKTAKIFAYLKCAY